MPHETAAQRRLRADRRVLTEAARVLRRRTGQAIAAAHLDAAATAPPHARYLIATLLEALEHDLAGGKVSEWARREAVALAQAILTDEDHTDETSS